MIIFILTENCAAISARAYCLLKPGAALCGPGAAGPAGTDGPEQAQSACQSAAPLYKQINS